MIQAFNDHTIGTMNEKIELYFDGSCDPVNLCDQIGIGILIKSGGVTIFDGSYSVPAAPGNANNNIAEYRALITGLKWLIDNEMVGRPISVFGDSNLVIKQMSGDWRANGGRYYPFYVEAKKMLKQFSEISFTCISRNDNVEAHRLSRTATPELQWDQNWNYTTNAPQIYKNLNLVNLVFDPNPAFLIPIHRFTNPVGEN